MKLPVLTSNQSPAFTRNESRFLLWLAVFGLLIPNGVFLWNAFLRPDVVREAMANPVSLVFAFEAFALMFLFAWVIAKAGMTRPGWKGFMALSLVGSLLFSVPLALRRTFGGENREGRRWGSASV